MPVFPSSLYSFSNSVSPSKDPYMYLPFGVGNCDFSYELTLTFDPNSTTVGEVYNSGIGQVIDYLCKVFSNEFDRRINPDKKAMNQSVEIIQGVIEYQKNFFPHIHLCIESSEELTIPYRRDIIQSLTRQFGRTSFKPVHDLEKYQDYMQKDLVKNTEKSGDSHVIVFSRDPEE